MKATVLHMSNTRDGQFRSISEIRAALEQGGEFYLAGEVVVPDPAEGIAGVDHQLEMVWTLTQNDTCPNRVYFEGQLVTDDFNTLSPERQREVIEDRDSIPRRYEVKPAVWNGVFPQRSSMVGDVVLLDDNVYAVVGCGFEWVAANIILGNLVLAENQYAPAKPEINHEFDQLITD